MRSLVSVPLLFLMLLSSVAQAVVVENGDFSAVLEGWTTEGDVSVSAEEAVIGDNVIYSALYQVVGSNYQGVGSKSGSYTLEFDFRNALSANPPPPPLSGFIDTFFATLYFTNDLNSLDIENSIFDKFTSLFDLYANGVFCDITNGSCTGTVSSISGSDWLHFSVTFTNTFKYIVPAFELSDWNTIHDSQVLIDNVIITAVPIPEPASFLLLAILLPPLAATWWRQRTRLSSGCLPRSG